MRSLITAGMAVLLSAAGPVAASAQHFPFERRFDVAGTPTLDVSTLRGKIDIVAGDADRVEVAGDVTVRAGLTVPANALELARQIAAAPPIERDGDTVRLRPPSGSDAQRAVTVSYRVRVPPLASIRTSTDSGATTVQGVTGAVDIRTQSAAIDVSALSGAVTISTGSGAVATYDISGPLTVRTASSGFSGRRLGSSLRVRTQSGDVDAVLIGNGNVDVDTGSSGVRLQGVHGGLSVTTQSGRVTAQGAPLAPWSVTTGSSSVTLSIEAGAGFSVDAASRSGAVVVEGGRVSGSVAPHAVTGAVGAGGPSVRVSTGSGAIRIQVSGGS